jgi:hypothetical protein
LKGSFMNIEDVKVGQRVRVVSLNNSDGFFRTSKYIKLGKTYIVQNVFSSAEKVIIKSCTVSVRDIVPVDETSAKKKEDIVAETFNPEELVV